MPADKLTLIDLLDTKAISVPIRDQVKSFSKHQQKKWMENKNTLL